MKVVVVHRGARDLYQVARAVSEGGLLERLVTDLYWDADRLQHGPGKWLVPASVRRQLLLRSDPALPSASVSACWAEGLTSFALEKIKRIPFAMRRSAVRRTDHVLGQAAGRLASQRECALLSYSYYAHSAFTTFRGRAPKILFQVHPHPEVVRNILLGELEAHPECGESLRKEWELALPEQDFTRLVEETRLADHWIAASSFTRKTLVEQGIPGERICVTPYGVDLQRFRPGSQAHAGRRLRLLFVGTINQRKGIRYLLDALQLLGRPHLELMVCGRVVDDLSLFRPFGDRIVVKPSISPAELPDAYRSADLFVFPSVAEGFGHVLLEALASGVPILSTTHTAAPDLITEGQEGFVVPPRRPDLLAERIQWALAHRGRLNSMRAEARHCAERFTWQRFRSQVASAVTEILHGAPDPVETGQAQHV